VFVPTIDSSLVARLHARAMASRWGLSLDEWRGTLERSLAKQLGERAVTADELERLASALHLEDLALAAACAAGQESAWEHFVREFRPVLYRAADAIDPTGGVRELADALHADLFGLTAQSGVRQSLFRYFHGRSSLATWLRAVLSQRHVDRLRATRRLDPLPEDDSTPATPPREPTAGGEGQRFVTLVRAVLIAAIAALEPRDRLRLGCYYAQEMTLAAIGRLLGEHEATVSRQLARTRRSIRVHAERQLRDVHGLDDPAIAECLRSVSDDPAELDLAELVTPSVAGLGQEPGLRIVPRKR
jgi:RNA polymerase sigma factor (sigma-70 family)